MLGNKTAYEMQPDNLIYDNSHRLDVANVTVTVPSAQVGELKRGQVLDFSSESGKYAVHASGGVASAIVAETESYAADDTDITVSVYISGTFRESACISKEELSIADLENLRTKSIYLK